jgi:hypothetical protein
MDIEAVLQELRQEHARLTEAILTLERMAANQKQRGRPPGWLAATAQQATVVTKRRGTPAGSRNRPGAE